MFLGTFGASLLGNILTGKRIYRSRKGKEINRAGEGIVRAGYGNIIKCILNTASSFKKLWNTKILSKWTKI